MNRLFLILGLVLSFTLGASAQDCVDVEHYSAYSITSYLSFPFTSSSSGNTYDKVAFYVEPVADGDLTSLSLMSYNGNTGTGFDGTFRVWAYADSSGYPTTVLAGPQDYATAGWTASYGTFDVVDLSALGYSFSSGVPFHVVWEFIPTVAGDALQPLAVTGVGSAFASQMLNATLGEWGWWFTGLGDLVQIVEVCYSETPPGNFALSSAFIDMGRIEVGGSLSEGFYGYNSGGMTTTLSALNVTNPAYFSASTATLPVDLAPGDSVYITVDFTPGSEAIFRDTTSVDCIWTSNGMPAEATNFFTIAGSSDGALTNDWAGAPDEMDWFVSASGDTSISGATWQLFSGGLNRNGPLAGHYYSAPGDTASSELYTFIDNASLGNITWRYAYTQSYPTWTLDHALLVYGVENDTLTYLYGFDVTSFQQQSPTWAHLTAELDSLPDSLACSFYYGGSDADSWFLDDVEFIKSCDPIVLDASLGAGSLLELNWTPFAGESVIIYQSDDAYDFSAATAIATVPSDLGSYSFAASGAKRFYRAVRDCTPVAPARMEKMHKHPDGLSRIAMSDLLQINGASRSSQTRILPARDASIGSLQLSR
jgi:hypothetical protein